MIPTVPQDVFISLSVGQLFALTAARDLRSGDAVRDRAALLRAAAFALGVFWPIGIYLMLVYPAWSWMYFVDPTAHPRWVGLAATLSYPLCGLGGYLVGRALVRAGRDGWAIAGVVAANAGFGALVILPWRRFVRVGTYAEWVGGGGVPILESPVWLRDMVIIGTVFGAAAGAIVAYNLRHRFAAGATGRKGART